MTKVIDNNVNEIVELYTPFCPLLRLVHHLDSIINPNCENSSLQIVNFNNKGGRGLPYTLPLHSIINQIEKWKEWEKSYPETLFFFFFFFFSNNTVKELVENKYHPFDYGCDGLSTEDIDDIDYYCEVINSRMECGGWEYFQVGIGEGLKSFKDGQTKSYLYHEDIKKKTNRKGEYQVDYERNPSLGFFILVFRIFL